MYFILHFTVLVFSQCPALKTFYNSSNFSTMLILKYQMSFKVRKTISFEDNLKQCDSRFSLVVVSITIFFYYSSEFLSVFSDFSDGEIVLLQSLISEMRYALVYKYYFVSDR